MLVVKNLSKSIQNKQILKDVSFSAYAGDVTVVLGPSGSGKTTLMRCLAKLDPIDEGFVTLHDDPLSAVPNHNIGMVFQGFNLFPHLSILDNLILAPMKVLNVKKEEACLKAFDLLDKFGLKDKADSYPSQLSGGQKQRIALCRCLMMDPSLLMMDEPTSALDPEMVKDVSEFILSLKNPKRAMIIISHEIRLAQLCADRVLFFDEGVLLDDLPKEDFFEILHQKVSKRAEKFLENYRT